MPDKEIPAHPNLEQYKKQAKEFKRACRDGDAEALAQLQAHHPRFTSGMEVALADAQLVLARQHGFESWPKFAAEMERRRIASSIAHLSDPVDAFLRAALVPRDGSSHASGTLDEANAILARYPQTGSANIYVAAALADETSVRAFLARDAALATATGGPYGWDALCHLCFSRYLRLDASRSNAFVAAARALLDAGVSPNTGWYEKPWRPGEKEVWESALYGAAGAAHHAGLTQLLLERGADPNDGETPYHAPESYDNTVVEILLQSGKVDERGKSWILARKADWHDDAGMRMALEYGANPNFVPHWGRSALQHAILRGNGLIMIQMLLDAGADPLQANNVDGRTGAQMAARAGRGDILREFATRGIDPKLSGVDRLIAACAKGDRAEIDATANAEPALVQELRSEGGELLFRFAGVGNTEGVECLLDLGVRVDATSDGDPYWNLAKESTALHFAAWLGWPETVKLLLKRGAPVDARDERGRTPLQLAVAACTDSYWMRRRSPEWVRPLLEAGANLDGIPIPCGYAEADELLLQLSKPSR